MVLKPEEKRRSPRIRLRAPIRFQIRGLQQSDNAISDDISIGGLSFTGNRFIAPETPVMLEINVLSRILHPAGRIAWSNTLAHSDRNRLGIEFTELNAEEKGYLADFINMQTGKL